MLKLMPRAGTSALATEKSFCFYRIKLSFSTNWIASTHQLGAIPGPCQLLRVQETSRENTV